VIRPVAILISAMMLSRPGIPKDEATRYARALNEIAAQNDIDPLTAVAIIHYETGFRPTLISADGEDHGLGQVRARYLSACREDPDPVHDPSEACRAAKLALLDGVINIRRMGMIIAANKEFCKKQVGSARTPQWLSGYQGYGTFGHFCTPGEKTWRVIKYQDELIERFAPKPKPKPKAPPKPKPKARPAPEEKPARHPLRPGPVARIKHSKRK
jgi:hypothetical protein